MADFQVTVEDARDHVAVVTFERAPANYFTPELVGAVADALESLAADGRTRAVVLRGEGRHFCAGADFSSPADGGGAGLNVGQLYGHAIRMFAQPLPVVAQLQGAVIGGGLGVALAADFRVAGERAKLAANFARIGIHQGFGLTVTLPRLVGEQRAADLLLTGRTVRAAEALALGLVDAVAPDGEQTAAAAIAKAAELAEAAPLAVRAIRATLREGLADQVRAAVARESQEQGKLFGTSDFREGVKAAAEKRPANFTAS